MWPSFGDTVLTIRMERCCFMEDVAQCQMFGRIGELSRYLERTTLGSALLVSQLDPVNALTKSLPRRLGLDHCDHSRFVDDPVTRMIIDPYHRVGRECSSETDHRSDCASQQSF